MTDPANTAPQAQLADEELDRLEALLDEPELEEAMRLDEIQGYLCAALSGPQAIAEEDWLIDILGSEEALASDAGQEVAALLRKFAEALEAELADGEPPVLLLYGKGEEEDARLVLNRRRIHRLGRCTPRLGRIGVSATIDGLCISRLHPRQQPHPHHSKSQKTLHGVSILKCP